MHQNLAITLQQLCHYGKISFIVLVPEEQKSKKNTWHWNIFSMSMSSLQACILTERRRRSEGGVITFLIFVFQWRRHRWWKRIKNRLQNLDRILLKKLTVNICRSRVCSCVHWMRTQINEVRARPLNSAHELLSRMKWTTGPMVNMCGIRLHVCSADFLEIYNHLDRTCCSPPSTKDQYLKSILLRNC